MADDKIQFEQDLLKLSTRCHHHFDKQPRRLDVILMQTTLPFAGGKAASNSSGPGKTVGAGKKPYTKINKATDASKASGRERSFDRQSLKDHNDIIVRLLTYTSLE